MCSFQTVHVVSKSRNSRLCKGKPTPVSLILHSLSGFNDYNIGGREMAPALTDNRQDNLSRWLVFTSRFLVMFFLTGSVKTGGILFNSISGETSGTLAGFILLLPYALGRLCGIGFACLLLPVAVCMKDHFREDFASVMPLSMMGSFAGMIAVPPFMELCHVAYGDDGTFILFGALCLHLIPCGLLLRKPRFIVSANNDKLNESDDEHETIELLHNLDNGDENNQNVDTRWMQRLKTGIKKYYLLLISPVFVLFFIVSNTRKLPADGWTLFLIPHTIEIGFTSSEAAQTASIGGLAGMFGRVIASLSFKCQISPILVITFYYFINGVVFIIKEVFSSFQGSLALQFITSAINACFLSAQSGMIAGLLTYIVEPDNYKDAFGLLDFGNGILALMAGITPGYILDHTGHLNRAFILFGVISILNGTLMVVLWTLLHFKRKRSN
ncbi:monocarboxylate transporter 12-like isoform X2 [Apostichopus japonicus]|uniref:monocarboxylate transporter 12-like isoform X2 n=1 Tax=Stichopus japonicus TaxID=307972 RepID=UPI003AB516BA